MIMDKLLLFSTAQNITSTEPSDNVIDLGVARDVGISDSKSMKILVVVTTGFTSTDGTLTVVAQGSTDNSTWDDYISSPALTAGNLVVTRRIMDAEWPRPASGKSTPRYLRLNYVVANAAFTPGAVTATLVVDRQDFKAYGRNFTV